MMKNKYKVLIITCWILLILAVIAKLFGADWFIASSKNESFNNVCNYIDTHFWLKATIMSIMNVFSSSVYYMALFKEKQLSLNSFRWFIPLIIYIVIKTCFYDLKVLFYILDIFMMILLPVIFMGIKNYKN